MYEGTPGVVVPSWQTAIGQGGKDFGVLCKAPLVRACAFEDSKVMVIAFKGTTTFSDVNIAFTKARAKEVFVAGQQYYFHKGAWEASEPIADAIKKSGLLEVAAALGFEVILTGHSLGGANAQLCAWRLEDVPTVQSITFATPPVACSASCRSGSSRHTSFVVDGDVAATVRELALAETTEMLKTLTETDVDFAVGQAQRSGALSAHAPHVSGALSANVFLDAVRDGLAAHHREGQRRLYSLGCVVLLGKVEHSAILKSTDPYLCMPVVWTTGMFTRHLPDCYDVHIKEQLSLWKGSELRKEYEAASLYGFSAPEMKGPPVPSSLWSNCFAAFYR